MKKTLAVAMITICVFIFSGLAATGCSDPCEKMVNKMIECVGKDSKEIKEKLSKEKDKAIKDCRKRAKKDKKGLEKAKKCLKESDCAKFLAKACIEKA